MPSSRQIESWIWYGFASLLVLCRFASRSIRLGGVRSLELEDYVMILAFGFYTNMIVWVNIQEQHPYTNILPPTGTEGMGESEIDDRVYGSKATFTIEESIVVLQMLGKVCMCLLFLKLTSGLKRQLQVKLLLAYVVIGWVVTEAFFFGFWCRPFQNYFRVFTENSAGCTTSQQHLIMSFTFNISSDFLMLLVPIPLLLKSRLPLKQKAITCGIFALGIFVILASVLNRYYCFAHPESILWIYWYVREASTAMIVINLPYCYALPRKMFTNGAFGLLVGSRMQKSKESKHNSDGGVWHGRPGSSETAVNFAIKLSKPRPTLQIWQRNEFGVVSSEGVWEDTEMQSIWHGGLSTTARIESDRSRSCSIPGSCHYVDNGQV